MLGASGSRFSSGRFYQGRFGRQNRLWVGRGGGTALPVWVLRGEDEALPEWQAAFAVGYGYSTDIYSLSSDTSGFLTAIGATYARNSSATYFDSAGVVKTATANTLRLDHHPSTLTALGYRAEGERTNLILRPAAIGGTDWSLVSGLTANTTAGIAPDSNQTLSLLQATSNSSDRAQTASMNASASTIYAASIVYKAGTTSSTRFSVFNGGVTVERGRQSLSWPGGVPSFNGAVTGLTRFLNPWTGGFYQLGITFDSDVQTTLAMLVYGDSSGGAGNISAWGADLEAGAFVSSVKPFGTGSAFTRVADTFSLSISGSEGSVYVEGYAAPGVQGNQVLWEATGNSGNDRIRIYRNSSGNIVLSVTDDSVEEVSIDAGNVANGANFKVAITWEAGNYNIALNGTAGTADTFAATPTISTQYLGNSAAGTDGWFGTVADIAIFDTAYSDAWLESVTA